MSLTANAGPSNNSLQAVNSLGMPFCWMTNLCLPYDFQVWANMLFSCQCWSMNHMSAVSFSTLRARRWKLYKVDFKRTGCLSLVDNSPLLCSCIRSIFSIIQDQMRCNRKYIFAFNVQGLFYFVLQHISLAWWDWSIFQTPLPITG